MPDIGQGSVINRTVERLYPYKLKPSLLPLIETPGKFPFGSQGYRVRHYHHDVCDTWFPIGEFRVRAGMKCPFCNRFLVERK